MSQLLTGLSLLIGTLWKVVFITIGFFCSILSFGRIRQYEIDSLSNATKINYLMENVRLKHKLATHYLVQQNNIQPIGFIIGHKWILFIETDFIGNYQPKIKYNILMICSETAFDTLVKTVDINISEPKKDDENEIKGHHIKCYREKGVWYDAGYLETKAIFNYEIRSKQHNIIEDILLEITRNEHIGAGYRGSFLIWGETGSGKSHIAKILNFRLKGILCDDFDPTIQGCNLEQLINDIQPTKEKPLIISLDEIDVTIKQIHAGFYKRHKFMRTSVYNKKTFNKFMDRLIEYNHVIFILTMNSSNEQIDELDKSYLRPGRIDKAYSLNL